MERRKPPGHDEAAGLRTEARRYLELAQELGKSPDLVINGNVEDAFHRNPPIQSSRLIWELQDPL